MPRIKNFSVIVHGFYFSNNFVNHIAFITTEGLCGGMSLAVFNYFRNGIAIPGHARADFGTTEGVPPEHSRLGDYIFSQQLASFPTAAPFFLPQYSLFGIGESDADYDQRHYHDSLATFNHLCTVIDNNKFALLGLRARPGQKGHQVLAFGYDRGHGKGNTQTSYNRIYIYDSNRPTREVVLLFDERDEQHKQMLWDITGDNRSITLASREYWSCFIQLELDHNYIDPLTEINRPSYIDITLTEPIRLNGRPVVAKDTKVVRVGDHLTIAATIRNAGDYDTEIQSLLLWAKDPAFNNRDHDLGERLDLNRKIRPGEVLRISQTIMFTENDKAGTYSFGVSYRSAMNEWLNVPLSVQEGTYFVSATLLEAVKPKVQAAILWPNKKAYFFHEDKYKKFDFGSNKVLDTYPRKIEGAWGQSSTGFFTNDIDAILVWPGDKKAYFFKGDEYIRYDIKKDKMDSGYPKKIKDKWTNWPASFTSVDAVVLWPEKGIYFFKGDEYLRYNIKEDKVDANYPRKIATSWGSWPATFASGVDAALLLEDWGKIYFFKDESYIKYDLNNDRVDNGYPIGISRGWTGL